MNIDCIREIAYRCNFKTTKKLLILYPNILINDFWKIKCNIMFLKQNYLDFYTGEENFLIKEKKDFVLAIEQDKHNSFCENYLFEYDKMLDTILSLSGFKLSRSGYRGMN